MSCGGGGKVDGRHSVRKETAPVGVTGAREQMALEDVTSAREQTVAGGRKVRWSWRQRGGGWRRRSGGGGGRRAPWRWRIGTQPHRKEETRDKG